MGFDFALDARHHPDWHKQHVGGTGILAEFQVEKNRLKWLADSNTLVREAKDVANPLDKLTVAIIACQQRSASRVSKCRLQILFVNHRDATETVPVYSVAEYIGNEFGSAIRHAMAESLVLSLHIG